MKPGGSSTLSSVTLLSWLLIRSLYSLNCQWLYDRSGMRAAQSRSETSFMGSTKNAFTF